MACGTNPDWDHTEDVFGSCRGVAVWNELEGPLASTSEAEPGTDAEMRRVFVAVRASDLYRGSGRARGAIPHSVRLGA